MSWSTYLDAATAAIEQIRSSQGEALCDAAERMVQAIVAGRSIYSFGASHSFMMTEEMVYRTGGLMLVNPVYPHGMNLLVRPLTLTSRLERVPGLGAELLKGTGAASGDALLLTSTSGRNAVAIDMALEARERGMTVIGITSRAYSEGVTSRHPSGAKMPDLCDVVIDNAAPYGDAAVAVPGFAQRVGPLSSVTGCAIVNALAAEVVARLVERSVEPPVFMSANVDGGDAYNARLLAKYRDRIHYLE